MQNDRGPAGLPLAPSLDGFLDEGLRRGESDSNSREPRLLDQGDTPVSSEARLPVPAPPMEITAPEADAERIALALMRSGRTEEAVSFLEKEIARAKDRAWKAGNLNVMRDITPDGEEIVIPPAAASTPPVPPVDSSLRPRRSALDSALNVRPSRADEPLEGAGSLHAPFDSVRSEQTSRSGRRMLMALALGIGVAGAAFLALAPQRVGLVAATEPVAADNVITGSVETASADPVQPVAPAPASGSADASPIAPAPAVAELSRPQGTVDDIPPSEHVAAAEPPIAASPASEEPASGLAALAEEPVAAAASMAEPRLPRVRPDVTPEMQPASDILTASLQPRPLGTISEIPAPQPAMPADTPSSYDAQQPPYDGSAYGSAAYGAPAAYPPRVLTPEEHEELAMRRRLAENYATERRREAADDDDDQIVIFDPYEPEDGRRLPLGPIRRLWGN